ncbi:hypothetical protein Tco_0268247 [Tanacetum coccineum]
MFVDDDGNSLVSTSYMDSENEVEVVFDETTNLMASMSSKGGNDKGYDNNSMLEQWRETNWDDDYDPIRPGIWISEHHTDSEPFEDPRSRDYTLALDDDTKMLDAPASPDYTTYSNSDIEPFEGDPHEADLEEFSEEDPLEDDSSNEDLMEADEPLQAHPGQEIPLRRPYRIHPYGIRLICILRKTVRLPFTLPLDIEAAITEEIAAPSHKRYRSPSLSSKPSSPSPLPSPSCKRCRSPSLPPPPPVPSSPPIPLAMLPPPKRFKMTSPQPDINDETMTETIIHARLQSSSAADVLLVIGESVYDLVPLIMRVESIDYKLETLHDLVEAAEQQIENMSKTRQELNYVAIGQLIAQRVTDAMTAYEANRNSINEAHNETSRSDGGVKCAVCFCSYKEFLTCKPRNFKGREGAVGLTRWFKEMEVVFHISNCAENFQVNYVGCTLLDNARHGGTLM